MEEVGNQCLSKPGQMVVECVHVKAMVNSGKENAHIKP